VGWFSTLSGRWEKRVTEPATPPVVPGGSDDLLPVEDFRVLLGPAIPQQATVLREFCVRASPIFRGEARRRMAERGQRGRQLEDDLVQDLIEECLKNDKRTLRKWDPERGPLRFFLRLLAHRRIQDQLRGRNYGRSSERMMDGAALANRPEVSFETAMSAQERDFWKKYQALFCAKASADEQELYQRFYVEEEAAELLAQRLNISVSALHKRLSRLRELMFDLRDQLLDLDEKKMSGRD